MLSTASFAQSPTPAARHKLYFCADDLGKVYALLDDRKFATFDELQKYVAALPARSTITYRLDRFFAPCVRPDDLQQFTNAPYELARFCKERELNFRFVPMGFR